MSQQAPVSPLNADHYDQLNQGLRAVHDAHALIAAAKASGMDTRAHEELANYLTAQIGSLKASFFPLGKPPT